MHPRFELKNTDVWKKWRGVYIVPEVMWAYPAAYFDNFEYRKGMYKG